MDLDVRLRTLLDEKTDAPCLIAGKILLDHAAAREYQRKLFVGTFLRWVVLKRVETRLAVRMIKALFKQTRRSRMVLRWTRPEDAVVRFDLLPRHAVVIGIAAARSDAQLLKHVARRVE